MVATESFDFEVHVRVLLIDDNRERLDQLEGLLRDKPTVGTVWVEKAIYMRPPAGLDAVFLTLPAAERWAPDFRSRKMQILKTSKKDQAEGFPPFVVTGVNLRPDDPKDAASQVRIILTESVFAIREFNAEAGVRIKNFGFFLTTLRGTTVEELSQLLHDAF